MDNKKEVYIVGALKVNHPIHGSVYGFELNFNLPLTWADGMIGVMPVFEDRESAEKYADDKLEITLFEIQGD